MTAREPDPIDTTTPSRWDSGSIMLLAVSGSRHRTALDSR
jgi:hypothetical protein